MNGRSPGHCSGRSPGHSLGHCSGHSSGRAVHLGGSSAGTHEVSLFCFLAEDFYVKTRLQFDETAKHLQNLESATRKAVCAAVKEFNRSQVGARLCLEGSTAHGRFPGVARLPWLRAQLVHWASSWTPVGSCSGAAQLQKRMRPSLCS